MNIADIRHQLAYRDTAPHRAIDTIKFIVVHHDAVEAPTDYDALALYKREADGHYNKDWDGDGKADGNAAKTILTGKGNGTMIIAAHQSNAYLFWTNGTTIYQHVLAGTAY